MEKNPKKEVPKVRKAKKKKKPTVEELLARIEALEGRQVIQYIPPTYVQPQVPPNQNVHYHGVIPCYNNPCYWA